MGQSPHPSHCDAEPLWLQSSGLKEDGATGLTKEVGERIVAQIEQRQSRVAPSRVLALRLTVHRHLTSQIGGLRTIAALLLEPEPANSRAARIAGSSY